MPEPAHDALQALRDRLEETRRHAERLAEEAAAARRDGDGTTDDGPDATSSRPAGASTSDLQAIAALLETLRELIPPELQQQLADVTRQILLLLRSLIDWWVDRLEAPADPRSHPSSPAGAPPDDRPVRDIPVD